MNTNTSKKSKRLSQHLLSSLQSLGSLKLHNNDKSKSLQPESMPNSLIFLSFLYSWNCANRSIFSPFSALDELWTLPENIIPIVAPYLRGNSLPDYWRTEKMSRLLRVNRQIYEEASYVLYTRCVFYFASNCQGFCGPNYLKYFVEALPRRPRQLVNKLDIGIDLYTERSTVEEDGMKQRDGFLNYKFRAGFEMIKTRLSSLGRVKIRISFSGDIPEKGGVKWGEMVDTVVELARNFHGVETLIVEDARPRGSQTDILEESKERLLLVGRRTILRTIEPGSSMENGRRLYDIFPHPAATNEEWYSILKLLTTLVAP